MANFETIKWFNKYIHSLGGIDPKYDPVLRRANVVDVMSMREVKTGLLNHLYKFQNSSK